jgi:integrase
VNANSVGDALMVLLAFRHGLRAGEVVDLRWDQIDFKAATLHVRRLKKRHPQHPSSDGPRAAGPAAPSARERKSRLDQPLDLVDGQVLACPNVSIFGSARCDCSIFSCWRAMRRASLAPKLRAFIDVAKKTLKSIE